MGDWLYSTAHALSNLQATRSKDNHTNIGVTWKRYLDANFSNQGVANIVRKLECLKSEHRFTQIEAVQEV